MPTESETMENVQDQRPVTVVMSVCNGEKTLDAAISSVLNQSYTDFQLIICDDASTDGTWETLRSWERRDERVTLLRNEVNAGAGPSRNRCLALAGGRYTALMDADDVSMPSRLAEQVTYLDETPDIDFVGTKGEYFCREPGDLGKNYWFLSRPQKTDFLMTLPFVHASLMFRTEVLRALGGYRDSRTVRRSEDYDLLMRAYAAGFHGANLAAPLYGIRLDPESYQRRKYRYRFTECLVKWRGFSRMGLMPRGIPYAIKPLFVGLIPNKVLEAMKERYYSKAGE